MKLKDFNKMMRESFLNLFEKPILFIPGVLLFAAFYAFTRIGGRVGYMLQTTPQNVQWVVFSTILLLIFLSVFSVFMISISRNVSEKKKYSEGIYDSFWKKLAAVFVLIFMLLVLFNLMNLTLWLFTRFMISMSPRFTVSLGVFRFLSTLISFVWVAGVIVFFSFSSFFAVAKNNKIRESVKNSFKLAKKEYLAVLSFTVLMFIVTSLIGFLNGFYGDVANYVLILPFTFVFMTKFVLMYGK